METLAGRNGDGVETPRYCALSCSAMPTAL
jgi:hypothetical protein